MGLFSKYINRKKQIIKPGEEKKIERCHVINCRHAKTFTLFFFTIFKIPIYSLEKNYINNLLKHSKLQVISFIW